MDSYCREKSSISVLLDFTVVGIDEGLNFFGIVRYKVMFSWYAIVRSSSFQRLAYI